VCSLPSVVHLLGLPLTPLRVFPHYYGAIKPYKCLMLRALQPSAFFR